MKKNIIYNILLIIAFLFVILYPCNVKAMTLDSIMNGADNFVKKGNDTSKIIDKKQLKDTSDITYNVLLGVGMVLMVIVGMILGIKYMMAGSEEKAGLKETLVPYFISCVVVFGGFTIWKIVINIIQ